MFKKPQYAASTIIVLLALAIISLPDSVISRAKLALSGLFLPLLGLAGSAAQGADRAGGHARSKADLLAELDQLRQENARLKLENSQTSQLLNDNSRLHEALGWQKRAPWKTKLARVILRDPANWWRNLQIDLGQRDGITTNMAVVTAEGLVGRVDEVKFSTARIVLIGDPNCRVPAVVIEEAGKTAPQKPSASGAHGIISSGSSSILDPTIVDLTYVDRQSAIQPGQRVVTSGLGNIFPRGIEIGQIVGSSATSYGLYLEARVKLSARLAGLTEVWVLLP